MRRGVMRADRVQLRVLDLEQAAEYCCDRLALIALQRDSRTVNSTKTF